jgi:hypothetical protein
MGCRLPRTPGAQGIALGQRVIDRQRKLLDLSAKDVIAAWLCLAGRTNASVLEAKAASL